MAKVTSEAMKDAAGGGEETAGEGHRSGVGWCDLPSGNLT